jgi:hypothetical protein
VSNLHLASILNDSIPDLLVFLADVILPPFKNNILVVTLNIHIANINLILLILQKLILTNAGCGG